jgi:hypothetical protein
MSPPVGLDLNLIWHCTCALFFKIDCWLGAYAVAHRQVWKNDCQLEKSARFKGSIHASESGICCLRYWPDETYQEKRQQTRLGIKNLLPLPLTRWSPPRAKAANALWNQEFAASAIDPMKLAKSKGSRHALESRICCFCYVHEVNVKPANQPLFTWRKFRPGIIIIVSIDSERDISAWDTTSTDGDRYWFDRRKYSKIRKKEIIIYNFPNQWDYIKAYSFHRNESFDNSNGWINRRNTCDSTVLAHLHLEKCRHIQHDFSWI